jgi:C-terminal processing protease CtpA/Prc
MEQTEIDRIVTEVAALTREHYVFPEAGEKIATQLSEQHATGRYDAVAGPADLAELVTGDLQAVNGDKHLRLLFRPEGVADEADPAEHLAAMTAEGRDTAGGMARVELLDGNVGYLAIRPALFPPSIAGAQAAAALSLLADARALVLDLRECRGGSPDMVALICGYLFDEPTHLGDIVGRDPEDRRQFWTADRVEGRRFGGRKPVFVLTSGTTFSGAEDLSYSLQQCGRATVIGRRTGGGAHPRRGFKLHPQLEATISVARSEHPVTKSNWEGTGVVPDVETPAEEALEVAYRLATEQPGEKVVAAAR